jgi:hypothetical protein
VRRRNFGSQHECVPTFFPTRCKSRKDALSSRRPTSFNGQ